jgi:hypothetical protein
MKTMVPSSWLVLIALLVGIATLSTAFVITTTTSGTSIINKSLASARWVDYNRRNCQPRQDVIRNGFVGTHSVARNLLFATASEASQEEPSPVNAAPQSPEKPKQASGFQALCEMNDLKQRSFAATVINTRPYGVNIKLDEHDVTGVLPASRLGNYSPQGGLAVDFRLVF